MCKRCGEYFTIHNIEELNTYLHDPMNAYVKKDLLEIWLQRGYITNLLYLEYLEQEHEKRKLS